MEKTREKLIKKEKRKFFKRVILSIVYTILIIVGTNFFEKKVLNNSNINKLSADAIVEDRMENYILLSYEVDGKKYNAVQEISNNDIKVGDKYSVLYYKDVPTMIVQENVITNDDVVGINKSIIEISTIIIVGVIIFIFVGTKQKIDLLKNGKNIKAICFDERKGFLQLKYKEEGQLYYFDVSHPKSKFSKDTEYDIYMDKQNPKKFMVVFNEK